MWSGLLVLTVILQQTVTLHQPWEPSPGTWACSWGTCRRNYSLTPEDEGVQEDVEEEAEGKFERGCFELCRLTCGKYSTLWPKPTRNIYLSHEVVPVDLTSFAFNLDGVAGGGDTLTLVKNMTRIFLDNLKEETRGRWKPLKNATTVTVTIVTLDPDTAITLDTNESYGLQISTKEQEVHVQINATTVYGARHGLETISQLTAVYQTEDGSYQMVMMNGAEISDSPAYPYRGLMVDTSRNFLTVDDLKRTLDGMAATKLNVLHWHATDSHSFPLVSPSVPQLSRYGAYSPRQLYTPDDVKDLTLYAKLRGIRLLLEIDTPSHSGNGWQWGPSEEIGDLAVCVNQKPWQKYCLQPPCGQLNPSNENLYPILKSLYKDVINIFSDTSMFHMGGDEVSFKCWNTSEEIVSWLEERGLAPDQIGFLEMWGHFQERALAEWDAAAGHADTDIMLWSSQLTDPGIIEQYLDNKRYIIETWVNQEDSLPRVLLEKGYRLVVATKDAWYLDHGFWGNTKYHDWMTAYANKLPPGKGVLGGEAAMWGERVDGHGLDSRIWPRAAAAGERLWSNPKKWTTLVGSRLMDHSSRLARRGLNPETIAPEWCYQNEGLC